MRKRVILLLLVGAAVYTYRKSIFRIPANVISAPVAATRDIVSQVTTKTSTRAAPYMSAINAASVKYGIPDGVLYALLDTESSFLPNVINGNTRSATGAVGIAQFLPSTAADELGLSQSDADKARAVEVVKDPYKAIDMAAAYLAKQRKHKNVTNWSEAVIAYNQGAGSVGKAKRAGGASWLSYIKPEGRNYLTKIQNITGQLPS